MLWLSNMKLCLRWKASSLTITEEALKANCEKAIERKTGARGLRAIMEENLLQIMYDIPDKKNVGEIIITDKVINENAEPEYVISQGK